MGHLGLQVKYFYSLTPRQFFNTVNGFRKKEEIKSKESWVIARRTAFLILSPNLKESAKEMDLMQFPWENELVEKLSEQDLIDMQEYIKKSEDVFARWDEKKRLKKLAQE